MGVIKARSKRAGNPSASENPRRSRRTRGRSRVDEGLAIVRKSVSLSRAGNGKEEISQMGILTHQCPHCLTNQMGLRILAVNAIPSVGWATHLFCPKCNLPCSALVVSAKNSPLNMDQAVSTNADILDHGWK